MKLLTMKRALPWLFLMTPMLAFASGIQAQASMVVAGTITLNTDGSVQGYTLDHADKLPPLVRQIVRETVAKWSFQPVVIGGQAVSARTGMSLRIVADMADKGQGVTLRGASKAFGCDAKIAIKLLSNECPAGSTVVFVDKSLPDYPRVAAYAGVGGTVFLVLKIGRDGHVLQAAARQVNLDSAADGQDKYLRQQFATATVNKAREWTFKVPTAGKSAARTSWIVQIPVVYALRNGPLRRNTHGWYAYFAGPVQDIPWAHDDTGGKSGTGADALAGSAPFARDPRFVLKTNPASGDGHS